MEHERSMPTAPEWASKEIDLLRAELAAAQAKCERMVAASEKSEGKYIRVMDGAHAENERLKAELAEAKARIAGLERKLALKATTERDINERSARIGELEGLLAYGTDTDAYSRIRARAERAEAHVVDLEEIVKGVHFLRKQAEAEADSLRSTIDNMRAMNIKLTWEAAGKVLAAEAERYTMLEAGTAALKDLEYFSRREGPGGDASRFASIYKLRAALNRSPAGRAP